MFECMFGPMIPHFLKLNACEFYVKLLRINKIKLTDKCVC